MVFEKFGLFSSGLLLYANSIAFKKPSAFLRFLEFAFFLLPSFPRFIFKSFLFIFVLHTEFLNLIIIKITFAAFVFALSSAINFLIIE